ncbi:hypothetical protein Hte_012396 [Hypoxylon texense]
MATEKGTYGQPYPLRQLSRDEEPPVGCGSGDDPKTLSVLTNNLSRENGYTYETSSPIRASTKKRRITHRKLTPIQVFVVNTTLGIGLYWRAGQILELGGLLAVILSFLLLGLIAWAITQCITELLCIWPVPGAMSVFVREFVDFELGIAVGIAYWFTYSVSFAALIAASASEVHYWNDNVAVDAVVLYLLVPLILVVVNSFGIEMYGWFEVATGVVKLSFLAIIMISMIVFATDEPQDSGGPRSWDEPTTYDETAAQSWVPALFICLSTATFSYVGVEVPAAAALEARPTKSQRTSTGRAQKHSEASSIGETIRFTSKWVSVFACAAYTLSGILISLSLDPHDCHLPRLDWLDYSQCTDETTATSAFTLIAEVRGNKAIANAFNFFQVFTALTCANDGDPSEPWYLNVLAWLGRTNSYRVPIRAMTVSALAFIWVPFLQLYHPPTGSSPANQTGLEGTQKSDATVGINTFISTLAEMGSVGVLIVWSCARAPKQAPRTLTNVCVLSIHKHQGALMEQRVPRVRRFSDEDENDYPYISNGQPLTAYLGLAACLLILLVLNGASLWNGFHVEPFLSAYLIVIIFVGLWAFLKLWRGAKWSLVDLSSPDTVIGIIRGLHEFSFAGFQYDSRSEPDRESSLWPLPALAKPFTQRGRQP